MAVREMELRMALGRLQLSLNQASHFLRVAQVQILATKDPELRKRAAESYNQLVRTAIESQFRFTE